MGRVRIDKDDPPLDVDLRLAFPISFFHRRFGHDQQFTGIPFCAGCPPHPRSTGGCAHRYGRPPDPPSPCFRRRGTFTVFAEVAPGVQGIQNRPAAAVIDNPQHVIAQCRCGHAPKLRRWHHCPAGRRVSAGLPARLVGSPCPGRQNKQERRKQKDSPPPKGFIRFHSFHHKSTASPGGGRGLKRTKPLQTLHDDFFQDRDRIGRYFKQGPAFKPPVRQAALAAADVCFKQVGAAVHKREFRLPAREVYHETSPRQPLVRSAGFA